jgi:hypothetical protein
MATLQAADIADLISVTQKELGKMRFTEIASDLQDHVAMNEILRKERVGFGSGTSIDFNVMMKSSGAAKNLGLFEVDNVNVADVMATGNVPWRHCTTNYAIERREIAMNRTPARIVELVKIRRTDALISLAELMETNFWGIPASGNTTDPFGVDYWILRDASGGSGFTAENNSNFPSGRAGIDSTASGQDNWSNWADKYTTVSKSDLVRKWRKGATFTKFKNPVPVPTYNTGDRYGYYTNYNVVGPLEEALEAQNQNLGNDIASKDGNLMFRGVPVRWVPQLENDSADPVYGINWGVFRGVFLTGKFMNETGPGKASNQHTVFQTHVDCTLNYICRDLRRCFVLDTAGTHVT